jgi:hypothetical protein
MKTFTLTLCLLFHAARGLTSHLNNPSFTCRTYADALRCRSEAVSDLKRPPQWELYPEGQGYIDKARGWSVTLYPPAPGHRYMVLLRVYLPNRIAIVTCRLKDGECRGPEPEHLNPVSRGSLEAPKGPERKAWHFNARKGRPLPPRVPRGRRLSPGASAPGAA